MTNVFPVSHRRKGKVKRQGWAWNKEHGCPPGRWAWPAHGRWSPVPEDTQAPGARGEGPGVGLPEEEVEKST